MSQGQLPRNRSVSIPSSRPSRRAATPIDPRTTNVDFEPCAATASIFLFTQGSTIICLHHDTLAIERRCDLHEKPVCYLAVDNISERNAGRLVASLDTSQTAIIWDLFNGQEIARFQPYDSIRVAAWMKNGNIAFGTSQGTVIIFEPSTSEHISARTIFDPITAIAPAGDCQVYAIGFMNGSIMIVTLQPAFTILHTLASTRAPSPVVNLAWHASSSKQKSDMLATQMLDGDLRVWSIAKPPTADTPRTIRLLKRSDNVEPGLNWCAWSKNGRVLQYSDGEAWSWDVRTKHAQYEPIPIVDGIRGLANYGPQGTLFTLGPNHTVQQYECNPPVMVKEAQYFPMAPPPAPKANQGSYIPGTAPPIPLRQPSHGSEASHSGASLSTIQRAQNEMQAIDQARQLRSEMASPVSSTSTRTDTMSSRSSNRLGIPFSRHHLPSTSSRGAASGTTFSTISPSMVGRESMFSGTSMYPSTVSITSSGRRSKGSRLRQEILQSPENHFVDLFPRTRVRLANIAYTQPEHVDQDSMTPDDLRRRMLSVVFGWDDDIEPLIRDELRYQQPGSTSAVLLSKWLGEVDTDMMAAAISSGNIGGADWMVFALSQMGGSNSQTGNMGQAFVKALLQQGDFHTSATILLGLGDREDAVEVYVSRNFFMEAILLTSLIFPTDWQRQAHLVRRWGEFVVENSQQQLAIRCFSCTGDELPMPWGSPSPKILDTPSQAPSSISSILSPPISPPGQGDPYPPIRMTTKNSSLKVITSFEAPGHQGHNRLPGLSSVDRTPTNGPGITPIAESAITPGNTPGGFSRSALRGTGNRTATPGGHHRHRLPSIGETPVDVTLPPFPRPSQLPTPDNSGSDLEREKDLRSKSQPHVERVDAIAAEPPVLLSSARYDPGSAMSAGKSPMTALPATSMRTTILPGPAADTFSVSKEHDRARNTSRDRKPDGLHIRMPSQDQIQHTHYISADGISSGRGEHMRTTTLNPLHSGRSDRHSINSGSLKTGRSDTRSDAKSPSISGQSGMSGKSTSISGRSIDQYISSLGEANSRHRKHKHSSKSRHSSREGRKHSGDHKSRSRPRGQDRSEDRGRDNRRYIRPAKRSPSSPVPMSPEHYADSENTPGLDAQAVAASPSISSSRHGHEKGLSKLRSGSKASDNSFRTVRPISPDGINDSQLGSETSHNRSKMSSRRPSPRAMLDPSVRGRSKSQNRTGSAVRSPSSPLPFSPQAQYYQSSDGDDDPTRLVEANRQRLRSRHRSESRRLRERGTSARRQRSPDRRRPIEDRYTRLTDDSESMQAPRSAVEPRRGSGDQMLPAADPPTVRRQKSLRTQRKELAARELEARRESLLRNPEAPQVPHPDEVSRPGVLSRAQTDQTNNPNSWEPVVPAQHAQRFPPTSAIYENGEVVNRSSSASVGPYGLPATPRAMRHPKFDNKAVDAIPSVPEIPDGARQLPETYYTGQPMHEFRRSMSAPIPEQEPPAILSDLPAHPAFHRGLHPGKRPSNFQPLGEIGQHRRRGSGDTISMAQASAVPGIYETMNATESQAQIAPPVEEPPLLPELQHLSQPPPPPPPQHFVRNDPESSSLSSNSNVGMINMILDNEPGDGDKVIEVPPPPASSQQAPPPTVNVVSGTRSPPSGTAVSPPPGIGGGHGHKRGRSDNFKSGFKGITDRLRSNSRGRNAKSPDHQNQAGASSTPSPYESVPPLYF